MEEIYPVINKIIRERRSVYPEQFSEKVIPEPIIDQLLENANWAPNHGLTQPWRFTVFSGNGLKKLADFQSELYKKAKHGDDFDQGKYEKLQRQPLRCSHIIAIGMKRQSSGKIPEIEEIEATACAVQNMYLTAQAYKIGCYWGSGGVTYLPETKTFLGLEETDKVLGFLYLGNIQEGVELSTGFRKPIENFVTKID